MHGIVQIHVHRRVLAGILGEATSTKKPQAFDITRMEAGEGRTFKTEFHTYAVPVKRLKCTVTVTEDRKKIGPQN